MMDGYHGVYHQVDVTAGSLVTKPIPDAVLTIFVGGVGLGTWILMEETPPAISADDPRAAVVLALSPLVGTPLTTSAKFAIVGKSPLTDRITDSLSSSQFALAARKTGADAIALVGQAPKWVTVVLDEDRVTLLPADRLLGLSAHETERQLRGELGADFAFLAIGVAGENQVRYATISHDGRHAGRGGLGATLGAKRIKAVAVRGGKRVAVADPAGVVRIAKDLSTKSLGPATEKYRELGTIANLLTFNRLSVLPTHNFQQGQFADAERISGEELSQVAGKTRKSCAACTIGCEHIFPVSTGGSVRLEYETLFALGSLCGIGDPDVVLRAAQLCDELGLDTISFGGTYAFACELGERENLVQLSSEGVRFGDGVGLLSALEKTGRREGIGADLAEGSRRLARKWAPNALAYAPQVKGLEIPGYDPRRLPMMALGFAVGARGADHNRSSAYELDFAPRQTLSDAERVARFMEIENRSALMDSLILCKFLRGVFTDFFAESAAMLTATTGVKRSADDLRKTASEIVLLRRRYNQREGWTADEDDLPSRFFQPLEGPNDGAPALTHAQLQAWVREYYRQRGLNPKGEFS